MANERFVLVIEMGNDAMQDLDDVARALDKLARNGFADSGYIRDENGNTVGHYELKEEI